MEPSPDGPERPGTPSAHTPPLAPGRWRNPFARLFRAGAPPVQNAHRALLVLSIVLGNLSVAAFAVWRWWPDPPIWLAAVASAWRPASMAGFFTAFGVSALQSTVLDDAGPGSESLRISASETIRPSLAFWGMALNILPLLLYVGVVLKAGR